jgi:putative SOS response-associated peptidase YedK
MCYNVAYIEKNLQKLEKRYQQLISSGNKKKPQAGDEAPGGYFINAFTHPLLAVVNADGITLSHWGLIPFWVKDEQSAKDIRKYTPNAMSETVFEKPSFRGSIRHKRALLPVTAFYEWQTIGKEKRPWLIKHQTEEIFSLGIITDEWVNHQTGEIYPSFSIITVPANPLLEKIHNTKKRMPLIIPPNYESEWINHQLSDKGIKDLMQTLPEEQLSAYTVSKEVNKPGAHRNKPEIMNEVVYG